MTAIAAHSMATVRLRCDGCHKDFVPLSVAAAAVHAALFEVQPLGEENEKVHDAFQDRARAIETLQRLVKQKTRAR